MSRYIEFAVASNFSFLRGASHPEELMLQAVHVGLQGIGLCDRNSVAGVVRAHLAKREKEGDEEPKSAPRVFINPEIVWKSEEQAPYEEGCLSIPDYYEEVERPAKVRVRYMDLDGKQHEEEAEGLFATCIQHEVDHLDGVLFIDYISKLKRDRVIRKFVKAQKLGKL